MYVEVIFDSQNRETRYNNLVGITKDAWRKIVTADDLDGHMLDIGQAEANAKILVQLLEENPIKKGKVYVPGCGTGQVFDFIDPEVTDGLEFLFSDIKLEFLEKLKQRLSSKLNFRVFTEDIEESSLKEKAEAVIAILLFEHVDWQKALANILHTSPEYIFIIIQGQAPNAQMVNVSRQLRPSIKKFIENARPELVDPVTLETLLVSNGFRKKIELGRDVPDNKRMLGVCYQRT
jgi:SAM-dependent methyltransferase